MLTLKNPDDPASLEEVTKENFSEIFGSNTEFIGIKIEITNDAVTDGVVEQHLPLLKDRSLRWTQRPKGVPSKDLPSMRKSPFNWKIGRKSFYVKGGA